MKIEYYTVPMPKMNGMKRKVVKNHMQRMWYMQLTKHSTITKSDEQALTELGIKLVEVKE